MYEPKFSITHNLLLYISRIEAAKALIEHSAIVPAWEAKFRDDARLRTVFHGTHLEGVDLTKEQTDKVVQLDHLVSPGEVLQHSNVVAQERDIQEVINYRNVIQWINQWQDMIGAKPTYSEEILFTLHRLTTEKILPDEQVGQYRKQQVVVRSIGTGEIAFRPPVSLEVPFLIQDFFEWLNSTTDSQTIHSIFKAAITHYELVRVHPFIEGNGRTGRALATLVMYVEDYDFKRFFSLEQYFDANIDEYYAALLSVQQNDGDMTYWLEYFCYGLAIELDRVLQQVLKLSQDLQLKTRLGQQIALSERQIILFELLNKQGEVTSQDAQAVLPNVSVDTILRDIKDLIEKGLVKKSGVTKGVTYSLKES